MRAISGITFETDMYTKKRYVRIDFDRYGKSMILFFAKVGVMAHEDDFWEEYATAITGKELCQCMYQRIDAWKWSER